MDLGTFDTTTLAAEGVELNLPNFATGERVATGSDGKPVKFTIYGAHSDTAQRTKAKIKASFQAKAKEDKDAQADELSSGILQENAHMLLKSWSDNFEIGGQKPEPGEVGAKLICSIPVIAEWVVAQADSHANFMIGAGNNSNSGSDKKPGSKQPQ